MKKILFAIFVLLSFEEADAQLVASAKIDMQRNTANTATLAVILPPPAGGASAIDGIDGSTQLATFFVLGSEFSLAGGSPYKSLAINSISQSKITNLTSDLAAKQPLNSKLTEYAAFTLGNGDILMRDGSGNLAGTSVTSLGQQMMSAANASAMKSLLFTGSTSDVVLADGSNMVLDTSNVPENGNLYFTNGRAVTAVTGQNVSLFTNDSGYLVSSALTPYLTTSSATATYATISSLAGKVDTTTTVNGHALSSNVTVTASDVSLGNVDNTSDANKPVSTAQATSIATKFTIPTGSTAQYLRGDGTLATFPSIPASQVNSDWNAVSGVAQILNKPTLGTSAALDVAASGNATTGQVVKGDDTRLTDSRAPNGSAGGDLTGSYPNPTLGNSGVSAATYIFGTGSITFDAKGRATSATSASARTFNYPSRTLNTCYQISSTQDADFHYKVDVTSSLSLTSGATGTVTMTSYTNSGCTTGAQVIADGQSGQSGSLVIGLNISQVQSVPLDGTAPANRWVKITTANTSGTPSFSIRSTQSEILL